MLSGGYMGRVLRIDLSKRQARAEALREPEVKALLGGRGLAAKYYHDEIGPDEEIRGDHGLHPLHLARKEPLASGGDHVPDLHAALDETCQGAFHTVKPVHIQPRVRDNGEGCVLLAHIPVDRFRRGLKEGQHLQPHVVKRRVLLNQLVHPEVAQRAGRITVKREHELLAPKVVQGDPFSEQVLNLKILGRLTALNPHDLPPRSASGRQPVDR